MPKAIRGYYRAAGRYLRTAHAAGKRFGICVEGTCGGWESQPYWSAKTGYAVCYLLSALGFAVAAEVLRTVRASCGGS